MDTRAARVPCNDMWPAGVGSTRSEGLHEGHMGVRGRMSHVYGREADLKRRGRDWCRCHTAPQVRRPGLTCTAQNLSQILVSWPQGCENGRAGRALLVCPVVARVTVRCPPSLTPQYLQLVGGLSQPFTSCSALGRRGPLPHLGSTVEVTLQTWAWVSQPWDCEGA